MVDRPVQSTYLCKSFQKGLRSWTEANLWLSSVLPVWHSGFLRFAFPRSRPPGFAGCAGPWRGDGRAQAVGTPPEGHPQHPGAAGPTQHTCSEGDSPLLCFAGREFDEGRRGPWRVLSECWSCPDAPPAPLHGLKASSSAQALKSLKASRSGSGREGGKDGRLSFSGDAGAPSSCAGGWEVRPADRCPKSRVDGNAN